MITTLVDMFVHSNAGTFRFPIFNRFQDDFMYLKRLFKLKAVIPIEGPVHDRNNHNLGNMEMNMLIFGSRDYGFMKFLVYSNNIFQTIHIGFHMLANSFFI